MDNEAQKQIEDQLIQEREALIEMYKAGFLDGYRIKNKVTSESDWKKLNRAYQLAFMKRFEKRVSKELKKIGKSLKKK